MCLFNSPLIFTGRNQESISEAVNFYYAAALYASAAANSPGVDLTLSPDIGLISNVLLSMELRAGHTYWQVCGGIYPLYGHILFGSFCV